MVHWTLGSLAIVASFLAFVVMQQQFARPKNTYAVTGAAGNIKAVLTTETSTAASGGSISVRCDGSNVTFSDNDGLRDLDATVGTIEVTPTIGDLATTGCNTPGEAVHLIFTDSNLITKSVDSTISFTSVNTIAIPSIQYPLSVTVKDAFGADITPDSITYNTVPPTATSAPTYFWASTAGSGTLVITKAGYVNASSTNTGLATVSTGTTAQTAITLGSNSAVSSAVSSGSSVTAQGLSPTMKLVLTDTGGTAIALSTLTIEKSTDGGTTFSSFTPSNISTNIGYDAVNPSGGDVMYRASSNIYPILTTSSITPSATLQTTVSLSLASSGRARGEATVSQASVPLIISPTDTSSTLPAGLENTQVTTVIPQPHLTIPPPTVLSGTSIQWNLPNDIPAQFLPATIVLSKVEGEGDQKQLTPISSTVIPIFAKESSIVEDHLTPGTLYGNRVFTITGYPWNFLLPSVMTTKDESSALSLDPKSTSQNPVILLTNPHNPPEVEVALLLKEGDTTGQYLQADGTLNTNPDWRPWYKWGYAHCLEYTNKECTKRDPDNRVLYLSDTVPQGTYTLSRFVLANPQAQATPSDSPLIVHYAPETQETR